MGELVCVCIVVVGFCRFLGLMCLGVCIGILVWCWFLSVWLLLFVL